MKTIVAVLSLFLVGLMAQPKGCTLRCMAYPPPQCAVYDGVYQLFHSGCARFMRNCKTEESWAPVEMEYCTKHVCPLPCSDEDFPVCGTNGVTFTLFESPCEFLNHACAHPNEPWSPTNEKNCN